MILKKGYISLFESIFYLLISIKNSLRKDQWSLEAWTEYQTAATEMMATALNLNTI